jgi:retron-type reverse transcriptase
MKSHSVEAQRLATFLLTQPLSSESLSEKAPSAFGPIGRLRSFHRLVERIGRVFGGRSLPPRVRELAEFLEQTREFQRIIGSRVWSSPQLLDHWPQQQMGTRPPFIGSAVLPALTTIGELAEWLELAPGQLEWFAGLQRRANWRREDRFEHYRYHWLERVGRRARLIEAPKLRLKRLQRRILEQILNAVPPHPAAHAYRSRRSMLTCIGPHVGESVVLHVDIRDFFPSISARRVMAIFRRLGYPERVARMLAALCTHAVPRAVLEPQLGPLHDLLLWSQLSDRHLPQGAPTSPALANLSCWRLDCRLIGLADRFDAHYTRYADDLVFSGDQRFGRQLVRFRLWMTAILVNEGFFVRHRKTRTMRRHRRQHVGGLILNERPNVPREEYDRLKAILFNCVRHGPQSQNVGQSPDFRSHLRGRIAYVAQVHPRRGEKLSVLFDRIVWPVGAGVG